MELIWEASQGEEAPGLAGINGRNQSSVALWLWYLVTHSLLTHTCLAEPRGHDTVCLMPARGGGTEVRPSMGRGLWPQDASTGLRCSQLWEMEE